MLHSRYGVLWMQLSILSPPNTTSEFLPKSSILVSSDHMTFSQSSSGSSKCSLGKLQPGLDMYWLKQGDTSGTAGFESLAAQCVTDGSLVTLVPALCRSFTRSPRVVLGFLFTVLVIILTPTGWDLAWSPRSREIISGLVCLSISIIAPTVDFFTPSCLPIADSVFQPGAGLHFVSGVLWQLFGLGHSGVWESDCLRLWTGVFYTDNEFKQMPLYR